MNNHKHLRTLTAIADSYGFYLERQKKHYIWKNSDGYSVPCAKTPRTQRCYKHFERKLRNYSHIRHRNK